MKVKQKALKVKDNQEICIWAFFDEESSKYINEIKFKINTKLSGPKFDPHLTLFNNIGSINKTKFDLMKEISEAEFSIKISPLEIQIKSLFFQSLFIKIKEEEDLISLRNKIKKTLELKNKIFFPHISLFYGKESEENKKQIIKDLQINLPAKLVINKIALVDTTQEIRSWKIIKNFPLRKITN